GLMSRSEISCCASGFNVSDRDLSLKRERRFRWRSNCLAPPPKRPKRGRGNSFEGYLFRSVTNGKLARKSAPRSESDSISNVALWLSKIAATNDSPKPIPVELLS